ncbi:MAG: glycosyltransferase family 4 protein [archaeon]
MGNGKKFCSLVLYPYPAELDGVSLQGEFLYRGLLENNYPTKPVNRSAVFEKSFLYKSFRPDVAIGIGFWGNIPDLVLEPQRNGIRAVPWLNADGWVANYHEVLNNLPLIMTTSNWVKETYIRDGVSGKNIFAVPIGIDMEQIRPIPKSDKRVIEMRKLLGVKDDEKMILTIGGDTTSKGFQEVLRALGKIGEKFTKWKYVGKAWENRKPAYHYKEELKIINEFGFGKKVSYIDGNTSRETMNVLLSAADIYAAPSRIEGFGMVQVEAQAAGTPVLSIDAMGVKDTVVHGKTGFLAKVGETIDLEEEWVYRDMGFAKKQKIKFDRPKTFAVRVDVDDLADYLLKLLEGDSLREKMGAEGRKHVEKNFGHKKVALDIARLIESKLDL